MMIEPAPEKPYRNAFIWGGIWLVLLTVSFSFAYDHLSARGFGRFLGMTLISSLVAGYFSKRAKVSWSFAKTGIIYLLVLIATLLISSYGAQKSGDLSPKSSSNSTNEQPAEVKSEINSAQIELARLETENKSLLATLDSATKNTSGNNKDDDAKRKELMSLQKDIARQQAELNAMPKKKFVTATKAGEHQPYVDACIEKIALAGNTDYPVKARNSLYGKAIVTFAIASSGELSDMKLERSSGHQLLDDALLDSIRKASPFDKFSTAIAKQVDQLYVTATFEYSKNQ